MCHNSDNDEVKVGPSLKGLFKHDKLKSGKPVNDANVRAMINMGGNGMPAFANLLSDDEKNDVIAYLKTPVSRSRAAARAGVRTRTTRTVHPLLLLTTSVRDLHY